MSGGPPFILNLEEVTFEPATAPPAYQAQMGAVGKHVGAKKLGYRITRLPPGAKAWPMHSHLANEEMFFVLEGSGSYRCGEGAYRIKTGDFIAAPAGGAPTAHQIYNDSTSDLTYLCVSTMNEPDVALYPNSQKFAVLAGSAPGGARELRTFSHIGRTKDAADYWEGE